MTPIASALAVAPPVSVAPKPMAMPDTAADATEDCPPMAMESDAAAFAPFVALPPIAVAPAPAAVTAVPPPPIATLLAPVAMESARLELAWKYLTPAPPPVMLVKVRIDRRERVANARCTRNRPMV